MASAPVLAQAPVAAANSAPLTSPKLLLKAGLRLTHLFYLPDGRNWQVVVPASLGVEYRCKPGLSLYAQAEADIVARRGTRGQWGGNIIPTVSANLGVGARYYFNQPAPTGLTRYVEKWGNYLALNFNAELMTAGQRGRWARGQNESRITPTVLVFCGAQHNGPRQRLLYDVNAGIGIEAPTSVSERRVSRAWNIVGQVNLRVCIANQRRAMKPLLLR